MVQKSFCDKCGKEIEIRYSVKLEIQRHHRQGGYQIVVFKDKEFCDFHCAMLDLMEFAEAKVAQEEERFNKVITEAEGG